MQILYRTVSIHEKEEGADSSGEGDGLGRCVLEEVVPYRQFTAQEIDLLGMMSGLEVRGVNCLVAWLFGCVDGCWGGQRVFLLVTHSHSVVCS